MAKPDKKTETPEIEETPESDGIPAGDDLESLPEETPPEGEDLSGALEDLLPEEEDTDESESFFSPPPTSPTVGDVASEDVWSPSDDTLWETPGKSTSDTGPHFSADLFAPADTSSLSAPKPFFDAPDFTPGKAAIAFDHSDKPEPTPHKTAAPTPAHFTSAEGTKTNGTKEDEVLEGDDGTDIIKAHKGDDSLFGLEGDDLLRGGHGDDVLVGGAGNDSVNGGKGEDVLEYTLADNIGNVDYYDGGKGTDTLRLNLTAEEYAEYEAELAELQEWIADNANPKASESQAFNDHSSHSAKHPVFETSWGLNIRNFENLEVNVTSEEPTPEPEPAAEAVVVDLAASATTETPPTSTVVTTAGTGSLPIESMTVSLSPDSQINVSMDVDVNELPPIFDVFMLQDLSGSFYDDLPNVQANFSSLYDGLTATSDVQFGIGSFVDKPIEPFGDSGMEYTFTYDDGTVETYGGTPDYVYNTDHAMSADKDVIQAALDGLDIYSGYDWKEAQLEALVQTALRGEEIGFRDGAQKFVVLQTDAPFHQEGDYSWSSISGSLTPDNNLDTVFDDEDYPSVTAVGELLESAGITPIFAVANPYSSLPAYQGLVDTWGFGYVTELTTDSSNIVAAINDGLSSVPLSLDMSVNGDDYGYVSSVTPELYEDIGPGTYSFDITLEIPEGSTSYSSDSLTLDVTGYGSIDVEVEIARLDATGDTGSDTLLGTAGENGLYGLAGDDVLDGRGGDDVIVGGAGNDTLTGGEGSDTFLYAATDTSGTDVIKDFQAYVGGDVLDFSDLFASFDPATDTVSDFVNFLEEGGNTMVQVDADGGGDSFVDVVALEGVTDMTVDDMVTDGGIII